MVVRPFPAYVGADEYFFVSYAHASAESIYPEMAWLNDAGFNLWYDEGIEVGSVWRRALANRLAGAAGLVFFATDASVVSENCLNEIGFALDEKKPVFVVRMDDAPLPAELRLSLGERQALVRSNLDPATFRRRLKDALSTVAQLVSSSASDPPLPAGSPTGPPTVAILPLRSLSNDAEYATAALTSAIVNQVMLSRATPTVRGTADDLDADPKAVAARLGARYILSGEVQRDASQLRLSILLTDATTGVGVGVGAERYHEPVANVVDAQDRLFERFANDWSHSAKLLYGAEQNRYAAIADEDLDGWGCWVRFTSIEPLRSQPRNYRRIVALLRRGNELSPDLLNLKSSLAQTLATGLELRLSRDVDGDGREALRLAEECIAARDHPQYLRSAASMNLMFGSEERALHLAERAFEMSGKPDNALIGTLMQLGRTAEAIEIAERLDEPSARWVLHLAYAVDGNYERAVELLHGITIERPDYAIAWIYKANALAVLDRLEEARDAMREVRRTFPKWSLASYEASARITWRNRDHVIEPLVRGLRLIELSDPE